jgi:hypothetical protein
MGWAFGSGNHDNSVCPSLACLDVKMYNFLNSEACICNVDDLHRIRNLAAGAQQFLNKALIGAPAHAAPVLAPPFKRGSSGLGSADIHT